ncbi:hypothetical protein MG293_017003 [Ovis ammon polii]|uniref:Uncharacterized protein n=1 Tax=Ovis ammon polii TaxID=230172 RepID=A0AAD4TX34_OVIAM|nr:hypothetical protein MG293_017003 [Ovis ammon polii]
MSSGFWASALADGRSDCGIADSRGVDTPVTVPSVTAGPPDGSVFICKGATRAPSFRQGEPSQVQQQRSVKNGALPRAGQLPSEAQSTNQALDNRLPVPAEQQSSCQAALASQLQAEVLE